MRKFLDIFRYESYNNNFHVAYKFYFSKISKISEL